MDPASLTLKLAKSLTTETRTSLYFTGVVLFFLLLVELHRRLWLAGENPGRKLLWSYAAGVTGAVAWVRWPAVAVPVMRPDEAQMIAAGLALKKNFFFFLAADSMTHGPLLSYPLYLLGITEPGGARVLQMVCHVLMCLLLAKAIQLIAGYRVAVLATFPLVLQTVLLTHAEYFSYNSQTIPILLTAFVLFLLSGLHTGMAGAEGCAFVLGLTLAAIPFAKLQSAVIGMFLCLVACLVLIRKEQRVRLLLLLVAGMTATTTFFVAPSLVRGEGAQLYYRYIVANRAHAGLKRSEDANHKVVFEKVSAYQRFTDLRAVWRFAQTENFVKWSFILFALGAAAAVKLLKGKDADIGLIAPAVVVVALNGVAAMSVVASGSLYLHYIFLMFGPLTLINGAALALWNKAFGLGGRMAAALIILPLTFLPVGNLPGYSDSFVTTFLNLADQQPDRLLSPYSQEALRYVKPGEKVAVWGWRCELWVETQTVPAARDLTSERAIEKHFDNDLYRRTFMSELKQDPPPLIYDSVSPSGVWYKDPQTYGAETFPELWQFLGDQYVRAPLDPRWGRIYVRKDRFGTHGK